MVTLNSKNKSTVIFFGFIFLFSCQMSYRPQLVSTERFNPNLEFVNFQSDEILNAKVVLKKERMIVDSGYFRNESFSDLFIPRLIFTQYLSIDYVDTVEIYILGKIYKIYNIEEKAVKSMGRPFIIEYTMEGNLYRENQPAVIDKLAKN